MQSLPPEPPQIHWKFYKQVLGSRYSEWVDEMKKQYDETTIPFPKDVFSEKLEKHTQKMKAVVDNFKNESNARIASYQCMLDEINRTTPIEQMTMEEFMISFPKHSPNFVEQPSFWPHTPEEQIGYTPPLPSSSLSPTTSSTNKIVKLSGDDDVKTKASLKPSSK